MRKANRHSSVLRRPRFPGKRRCSDSKPIYYVRHMFGSRRPDHCECGGSDQSCAHGLSSIPEAKDRSGRAQTAAARGTQVLRALQFLRSFRRLASRPSCARVCPASDRSSHASPDHPRSGHARQQRERRTAPAAHHGTQADSAPQLPLLLQPTNEAYVWRDSSTS